MGRIVTCPAIIVFKNDNGEGERLRSEFYSEYLHPYLFWKTNRMARISYEAFGISFIVTSVYRLDSIPHSEWRGIDIRTFDPIENKPIITSVEFSALRKYHNENIRRFGNYDSFYRHEVRGEDGKSRGEHIHTQCPKNVTIKLEV